MPFDKLEDIDKIDDYRRNSVMKSIRTINIEGLKKLADEIFHSPDDPWRQTLLKLIAENPGATFYHADAGEGVMFLYSRDIRQRPLVPLREWDGTIVGTSAADDERSDRKKLVIGRE
jgi:hypothetical protein